MSQSSDYELGPADENIFLDEPASAEELRNEARRQRELAVKEAAETLDERMAAKLAQQQAIRDANPDVRAMPPRAAEEIRASRARAAPLRSSGKFKTPQQREGEARLAAAFNQGAQAGAQKGIQVGVGIGFAAAAVLLGGYMAYTHFKSGPPTPPVIV